jgi:hypothetical protein
MLVTSATEYAMRFAEIDCELHPAWHGIESQHRRLIRVYANKAVA